jgi:hypothetical protein
VIDLQEVQDISSISANFFTRFSLLDFASICAVYTSVDNINYKIVDSPILHSVDPKEDTTYFATQSIKSIKSEICKVFAKNLENYRHSGLWR